MLKYFSEKGKVAFAEYKTWIITLQAEQYLAPKFNKAHWTFFVLTTKLTQNPGGKTEVQAHHPTSRRAPQIIASTQTPGEELCQRQSTMNSAEDL